MSKELKHKIYSTSDCITEQTMFDYIDGKLSSKEEHVVEKHMIDCEICSDALEGLRLVKNRDVIAKINEDVRARIATPDRKKPIDFRFLISAAAGVLLLAGGVFFFKLLTSSEQEKMAELKQAKEIPAKEITTNEDTSPSTESLNKLSEVDKDNAAEENKISKADELEQSSKWKNQVLKETETGNGMSEGATITAEETVAGDLQTKSVPDQDNNRNNNAPVSTSSNTIATEPSLADKKDQEEILQRDDSKVSIAEKSASGKGEEQNSDIITLSKKKENKKEKAKNRAESTETTKQEISMNDEEKPAVAGNSGYWENDAAAQKPGDQMIADSTIIFSGALDPVYSVVEEMPKFPGGDTEMIKYIQKNLKYPPLEKETATTGTIYIQFVVDKTGNVINPKVFKGINQQFDKEALDVFKNMPKWIPGRTGGKPVNVLMNIPVKIHPR